MNSMKNAFCPWLASSAIPRQPGVILGGSSSAELNHFNDTLQGDALYENLKNMLCETNFIPEGGRKELSLVYLATFTEIEGRSVFTREQQELFEISDKTDRIAAKCLRVGCCITVSSSAFVCVAAAVAQPPLVIAGAAVAGASAIIGYFATGVYPDRASATANDRQDAHVEVANFYRELGETLIVLTHTDRDFALKVVQNLQLHKIVRVMQKHLSEKKSKAVIEPLVKAKNFCINREFFSVPMMPIFIEKESKRGDCVEEIASS